jgi:hypothetical protein
MEWGLSPVQMRSGCVFVQIDLVSDGDDFTLCVVAAGGADVMRALELTAIVAFVRICRVQGIVSAALVAARLGNLVLLDGHVSTSILYAGRSVPGVVSGILAG